MATQSLGGRQVLSRIPRSFIRNGVVSRRAMYEELVENNTLREDETREVEEALTRVARRDLNAVADLRSRGLTVNLRNIGVSSFEFDRVTPVGEATQSMSILNLGDKDLATFARTAIPVPVTASAFDLDSRQNAAGTTLGESVSLTNVEEHTRSVAEKLEDTLVNGSDVVLGGNGLPGYTDLSSRQTVSFNDVQWASTTDLTNAVTDTLAMRTALRDNGFTGPYNLYLPANWDGVLDEDYKTDSDRTLRERLSSINGIEQITVLPSLADSNAVLVQMTRSVVEAAIGQDITTVTWDTMGGMSMHWAILAVMTFALKVSAAREALSAGTLPAETTAAGIAHLS